MSEPRRWIKSNRFKEPQTPDFKTTQVLSQRELALQALRKRDDSTDYELQERPVPNHEIDMVCQRVIGRPITVKPNLYVYRPTSRVTRKEQGILAGGCHISIDNDTKKVKQAVITMADTVYKDETARRIIYAHELTEFYTHSHKTATKVEDELLKEYGMTRKEMNRKIEKNYEKKHEKKETPLMGRGLSIISKKSSKKLNYY